MGIARIVGTIILASAATSSKANEEAEAYKKCVIAYELEETNRGKSIGVKPEDICLGATKTPKYWECVTSRQKEGESIIYAGEQCDA